ENETVDGNKVYTRTSKYFTPHAFRYTIPTILSEMGVPKDSLKFLLGHSQFKKGSLPRYIHTVRRQQRQIYTGQLILETILETALELEQNYNIQLDIEYIEDDLEKVFEIVYRNENEIEQFKNELITFAFTKAQQELNPMGTPLQQSQHQQHVQFQY